MTAGFPRILPKILIVDDTPANLVALRRLLAKEAAEVVAATSGNEALALALDHEFALILLDVNMPDMDGFETAELLRGEDATRHVPIIFVTAAHRDELHRIKGYSAGAVDYIEKPINDTILLSKVGVFLDLHRQRFELHRLLEELADRNRRLDDEVEERRRTELALRDSEARFRDYAHAASDWFWEMGPHLAFTYVSLSGEHELSLRPDDLLGRTGQSLVEAGLFDPLVWTDYLDSLMSRQPFHDVELPISTPDGRERYIRFSGVPRFDESGRFLGFRGVGTDITERRYMEERIRRMALYDPLTELPNRALFQDRLRQAATAADRKRSVAAVFFLDLDGFKAVNDALGHEAGDELLRVVAVRLQGCLRDMDTVARLGGDEFAITMEVNHAVAREEAELIAGRILEAIAEPVFLLQGPAKVGTSIGIALYPLHSGDIDECLRAADMAMYAAKRGGKSRYAIAEHKTAQCEICA